MPRRRKAAISSPEFSDADQTSLARLQSPLEDENAANTSTKPPRNSVKRRPSAPFADASNGDYTVPLNDASPSNSRGALQKRGSGFTELDDHAEKRKRRRSTRVSFAGQPEGESMGDASRDGDTRSLPNDISGRDTERSSGTRPSLRTARLSTGNSLRINSVAPAPAPAISMDVMNSNFEEWMKMATDNVCWYLISSLRQTLISFPRKSTLQTHGILPSSITSMTCHC
jgi:condensin complex subunit 2